MAQRCHRAEALLGFGASVQDAFAGAFATVDQTVASARAIKALAFGRVLVPSPQPPGLRPEWRLSRGLHLLSLHIAHETC
jgi:hypothetical protein